MQEYIDEIWELLNNFHTKLNNMILYVLKLVKSLRGGVDCLR